MPRRVGVSHASIWELGFKWRKDRIAGQPRRITDQALRNRLRPLVLDLESLLVSSELRHDHPDPFDRLLYGQAKGAGYRRLSIDRTLASVGATLVPMKP